MKNSNKKGFTLVELLVVIAILAILATVAVVGYTSFTDKANLSVDQQAVTQMNKVLMVETEISTFEEAIDLLEYNGINAADTLVPISKNHAFYWYKTYNTVVLVNTESNTVVYPEDEKYSKDFATDLAKTDDEQVLFNLRGGAKYIDVVANDVSSFAEAITNGVKNITLEEDIANLNSLVVVANTEITIDLGGNNLTTAARNADDHQYALNVYGTVTLTNGTIDARGVEVRNGGKLIIGEGVTINAIDDNGGAAIYIYEGGVVEVNGGTFTANAAQNSLTGGSVVLNNGGTLTINGGTFTSEVSGPYVINHCAGTTIINGGTFSAVRGLVGAVEGTVTINGGEFTLQGDADSTGYLVYTNNATVVINGGTFTNTGKCWNDYCVAGSGSITIDGKTLTK